MRTRSQPGQESIPIPIPTPTPIQTMIGLIGHTFLKVVPEGTNLFGRTLATGGHGGPGTAYSCVKWLELPPRMG